MFGDDIFRKNELESNFDDMEHVHRRTGFMAFGFMTFGFMAFGFITVGSLAFRLTAFGFIASASEECLNVHRFTANKLVGKQHKIICNRSLFLVSKYCIRHEQ